MKTLKNNPQLIAGIKVTVILAAAFITMIAEHGFRSF